MDDSGDVLEARFQLVEGRWQPSLIAGRDTLQCEVREALPDSPDELLRWIVSPDEHPSLLTKTWRLRVRPSTLGASSGPLPPVLSWPRLLDGGQSVFLRDWTLCVLYAPPESAPWECCGDVAVVRDAALANELTALHLPKIAAVDEFDAITEGAIVVIPAALTAADVTALRVAVEAKRCPLVIWCGTVLPAPSKTLLEVVPTGEPLPENDGLATWLTRLLTGLLAGVDPERALARSMRDGPPGPLDSWLLRGCLRPWKVKDDHRAWQLRFRHWRFEIDRTEQNAKRVETVVGLLDSPMRRVQVVLLAGVPSAGIGYFRARPLRIERPGLRIEECAPAWQDRVASTLDQLHLWFKVKPAGGTTTLRNALQSRLAGARALLVHVNHEVADDDTLTDEALNGYLTSLSAFGASLPDTIRLLVSVYVSTPSPTRIARFKTFAAPALGVKVLPPIEGRLPEDEIDDFLADRDIEPDAAKRAELASELAAMPYEDIVKTLSTRYHSKLRAP